MPDERRRDVPDANLPLLWREPLGWPSREFTCCRADLRTEEAVLLLLLLLLLPRVEAGLSALLLLLLLLLFRL